MNAHLRGPASESPGVTEAAGAAGPAERWRDPSLPPAERAADLLARMTLAEKLGQLASVWLAPPGDDGVAPMQGEFTDGMPPFAELIQGGLGQITRVFGSEPVSVADGMATLASMQRQITAANRFGIPAMAHEECLTGFTAWTATVFPTPLAWGAAFDPGLVEQMAAAIGESMRAVGIHQGLAPVLDVVRDTRWGRVEETMGEDPYLVGIIGTAYVRGLQSAGIVATLKHFAGYSASRAGRNMAPVSMGRREFADVLLTPFEMAIREGGARSVMHAYVDVDGVPAAADRSLLTGLLREELGFDGVVVADYYGISFLETMHRVAGSADEAGALALRAGVDVELPNVRCYGPPLAREVEAGRVPEQLVDRAVARVLRQKIELGLLDGTAGAAAAPGHGGPGGNGGVAADGSADGHGGVDLDPPAHRALARTLAEESVILLANSGGVLPLEPMAHVAVVGPLADDPLAFFGCYTFPQHVLKRHPGTPTGLTVPTLLEALRYELPQARISHARGCDVTSPDRSGFAAAVDCARAADVVVVVAGDEAGMFGLGTSGEGCDATDLRLPGVQQDLITELVATGKPVALVLVTGRPYALGEVAGGLAAAVQAFFPGQAGGTAIAGVLSGRVVPAGKLPVEVPSSPGAQPATYLRPPLAGHSPVSTVDPTPLFPFGHGLSYTTFEYTGLELDAVAGGAGPGGGALRVATDGTVDVAVTVRNTGSRAGTEVVQLYLSDPVAQVVRPSRFLAGFVRVPLEPGQASRVVFRLHADRTAFCGRSGAKVVEPGAIGVAVGASSGDLRLHAELELTGPERVVGADRVLTTPVTVSPA